MTAVVIYHVEIDDTKPLGPQIASARAQRVPWKVLERALGRSRQLLDHIMRRALDENANDSAPAVKPSSPLFSSLTLKLPAGEAPRPSCRPFPR